MRTGNEAALKLMFSNRCPYCRSVDFRSVGFRNGIEKSLSWLARPYRCELCGRHFFLFRWLGPIPEPA